ncbi:DUF2189 domain-containing protein [Pararhodobacter sp. SW119]|uniref:DUF2189 domain-containing protein n=1 Tax=Pararhodobacter sp. SW119 TaxID=2780075 RepID=UPI001ADF78F9|nr:DUF2189 domain-containing protein [Pararhodobacter sp. SW119]
MSDPGSGALDSFDADIPPIRSLTTDDLRAALADGWTDFKAAPAFGLFFAVIYTLGGMGLFFGLLGAGEPFWFIPVAAGFPLLAPFAAVGLYEVSRRREAGEPLKWGPVLGALRGHGDGQLPVMAVVVLLAFGFWVILARGIFAIFVGQSGIGAENLGELLTLAGTTMLLVGTVVGGLMALALFSVTAFSLPMLLHRPVDFVTAIVTSIAGVWANGRVMLLWAAIIAGLLIVAMLPLFLGLLIVLPLLGHATWHLYRRVIAD